MRNALALGTFDGLHTGHMSVINSALQSGFESIAVIFADPPAASLLNKEHANILDAQFKIKLLKQLGFADVIVLDFAKVKDIEATEFLENLVKQFNPEKICCGFNYTFGKDKRGNVTVLEKFCKDRKIELSVSQNVTSEGISISSTYIRSLIGEGNVKKANTFLNVPFGFCAEVLHGDERGRTIGFPTINQVYPKNLVLPRFGVYASRCTVNEKEYNAITNIGLRPTFKTEQVTAETYILDFNEDLYAQKICVTLDQFLRDEIRFENIDALKNQISLDIKTAFGGEK